MMKNFALYILFFVFCPWVLCAQVISQDSTLKLDSDMVTEEGYYDSSGVAAHTFVRNLSDQDIKITWRKYEDLPTGWTSSLCDKNICHPPERMTGTIDLLANGDSSLFEIQFYPHSKQGSGEVQVVAYIDGRDSTATVVKAVFNGIAEKSVVGVVDRTLANEKDNIKIYPNPAKDYILIRNLPEYQRTTVEIYNIFGKRMLSFSNPPSSANDQIQKFNIESLSKGIYMIRIYDAFMNVLYTKSISKVNH